jgi:hypothetical protein
MSSPGQMLGFQLQILSQNQILNYQTVRKSLQQMFKCHGMFNYTYIKWLCMLFSTGLITSTSRITIHVLPVVSESGQTNRGQSRFSDPMAREASSLEEPCNGLGWHG